MNRLIGVCLLVFGVLTAAAQGTVKGKVLSKTTNEPLEFINITVSVRGETKILKGAITDGDGSFAIAGLADGSYVLRASFMGYKEATRQFTVSSSKQNHSFSAIYLSDDAHALQEVTVTGQRQEMKLEVDRKSFNVDQQIANAGGAASDVLENIPSVEVDNDGNVSLRGNTSVEVWINGKSSGLTSDNRAEILQQLPAESIERIEVIDNPSAKFSAEGSAGIINIVLKKERKAGYYGSYQVGGDTRKGANASFNVNYNSARWDAYANIGFRHRRSKGGAVSEQTNVLNGDSSVGNGEDGGESALGYTNYRTRTNNQGNNLFSRAGVTWHATSKDDLSFNGMLMLGGRSDNSLTPYHYGLVGAPVYSRTMYRYTRSGDRANMMNGEINYRHNFTDRHFLDFVVSFNRWSSDNKNTYQDLTEVESVLDSYSYQSRPQNINNRTWEVKLDYENPVTERFKLQAGYNGRFSHENTPQESYEYAVVGEDMGISGGGNEENVAELIGLLTPDDALLAEDKDFFNRFIYDMDVHALYATGTYNFGKFGLMAGLRGEYWRVNTKSYDWNQEHQTPESQRPTPFKKDYFELFPSVFMSYQLTPTQQLQLNYTRRLRRPWGGQLNSFKNTRDATVISYGNPELTPEFSNSFSLNYLKTWTQHSLLVSAYYRPTTDVMQRISYQNSTDGLMYQTHFNVAKSTSTGLEITAKDKIFRIIDLSTSANFYYYKLDGFSFDIDGQTVTGESNHNFTWNARMQASVMLTYDISFQATGRYRSREVITQGYRKAGYNVDLGVRKSFLNKRLTLAVNCRDLLNSRRWKTYTESDTFTRHQENWRNGRSVRATLTWNFGNMNSKKRSHHDGQEQEEDFGSGQQYDSGGGEE